MVVEVTQGDAELTRAIQLRLGELELENVMLKEQLRKARLLLDQVARRPQAASDPN